MEQGKGETTWLSHGFEQLLCGDMKPWDVVVVGSGYGGAIAAAGLAGSRKADNTPIRVCVLERGREYLPGMFPSRLAELPRQVRFSTPACAWPRGNREGLFDVRIGPDVNALLASGLGGGSLINAGVMEQPHAAALAGWPGGIASDLDAAFFDHVKGLLGARDNTISRHPHGMPPKTLALRSLAGPRFSEATISVGLWQRPNEAGVQLAGCRLCGDCATGCNHGAKDSLDLNQLARAFAAGAQIFTGATVLRLERDPAGGWRVHVVHTDEQLRKRQGGPLKLTARQVVLAAGTFGSTEILLRSRSRELAFSPLLGQRFSANGDAIAVGYRQNAAVNAVADESVPPWQRGVGPTITGMLDFRGPRGRGPVLEEIAIPGPLRRVFEETVTTVNALHELADADRSAHRAGPLQDDPAAVDAEAIGRSSIFVMMGDDGAAGSLELLGRRAQEDGDGAVCVRWPGLRDAPLYRRQVTLLRRLTRRSALGGRVLPNPLWQLLPESMQFLLDSRRGPALTVHPLGGCAMGSDAHDGVVDHLGRVFDPEGGFWPGLAVLDGSIVRNALGINPALTIAALAVRATPLLRQAWGFVPGAARQPLPPRPRFRAMPRPAPPRPTEVQVVERMSGDVWLAARETGRIRCRAELTLEFGKAPIVGLRLPTLHVQSGELRVFRKERWDAWRRCGGGEDRLDAIAELRAPVQGTLTLFERGATRSWLRRAKALYAWFLNRGFRDSCLVVAQSWREGFGRGTFKEFGRRAANAWALGTRAGEVRKLSYALQLGAATCRRTTRIDVRPFAAAGAVEGVKTLTYGRRANPWRQLMEMKLERLPGLAQRGAVLALDAKYLAGLGVPLLKLVEQGDQVSGLADMAALAGYLLRLLLGIHVWSFRRPETPTAREPQRLPRGIPDRLPEPEIREIELDPLPDGAPVRVRLTRYRPRRPRVQRPVVMIHGYSASGTTFAHHAVKPNMAEYFFRRGRDVWILDLRTSSGMPTARHPWAFEDAAYEDLPAAFERIARDTGQPSFDVFAHCMGSAMFSMAVLAPPDPGDRFFAERQRFPQRVHRAVLSQIAPVVVMSPANVFRGYAMSYLRHFLPFANYEFRVAAEPGMMDQLLDRLLATLPYPEEEFDAENRFWPCRSLRFVGTRHRMDALYGRDFSLADSRGRALLSDEVLEHIDDLFGPLSIDTVAQAIHFARLETIATVNGRNDYVLPRNLRERWTFPTLSVHGAENGLADVATLERFRRKLWQDAGIRIETCAFRDFGHQDSLIGVRARRVFRVAYDFLMERRVACPPR